MSLIIGAVLAVAVLALTIYLAVSDPWPDWAE